MTEMKRYTDEELNSLHEEIRKSARLNSDLDDYTALLQIELMQRLLDKLDAVLEKLS